MTTFKLRQELIGHEQDVRAVSVTDDIIYSASRDGSVRQWTAQAGIYHETNCLRSHKGFVNAVASSPTTLVSGGQDRTIYISNLQDNSQIQALHGHNDNICSLTTSQDETVISGSWDGTAKIWDSSRCLYTLEGHQGAVWTVLSTEHGTLTGGADRTIRLWQKDRQIKSFSKSKDCIRALALHPLGFVSAGNDALIRIQTFDGEVLQVLEGHDSFIYSLAVDQAGNIYSSGEDRTLRIWRNGAQAQVISHPAISIWSVALLSNGDVVTGASDGVIRIFTTTKERQASSETIAKYEAAVAASAIPAQSQNIPNNLPGLEALSGPGKQEGEVKMIRTSPQLVEAHQWTGGIWVKIGEVIGAGAKKVNYEGKDYDFVFDVDIAEGVPPLKLPYNTDENPYEAANRFIEKYELDVGFQAQIVKFIETNTGGIPLGVPKASKPAESYTDPGSNLLPQTQYLCMNTGKIAPAITKLSTFESELTSASIELGVLSGIDTDRPSADQFNLIKKLIQALPREKRFPAIDILRLLIARVPTACIDQELLDNIMESSELSSTTNDKVSNTNQMLGLRSLANLFNSNDGAKLYETQIGKVLDVVRDINVHDHKLLCVALSTFLLNTAVFAHKHKSPSLGIDLIDPMSRLLNNVDSEVRFRALVGLGTALTISSDVIEAAKEVFEVPAKISKIQSDEKRINDILQEIRGLLQ